MSMRSLFIAVLTLIVAGSSGSTGVWATTHADAMPSTDRQITDHHLMRGYQLRSNPEVTRRVATELIVKKLPQLATLVGLTSSGDGESIQLDDSELSDPTKALPEADVTTRATLVSYNDSELSEEEAQAVIERDGADEISEDDLSIDDFYSEFTNYMASLNGEMYVTYNGIDMEVAMVTLVDWLGTRYRFGGVTRRGIDCSAFTRMIYRTLGYQLPRTAAAQWDHSDDVIDREELQFGDLVFFHTRKGVYVGHVGMYLDNGFFAHASSRNGVTVSSLNSNYYSTHFIGARRYDVAGALADAARKAEADSTETSES